MLGLHVIKSGLEGLQSRRHWIGIDFGGLDKSLSDHKIIAAIAEFSVQLTIHNIYEVISNVALAGLSHVCEHSNTSSPKQQ